MKKSSLVFCNALIPANTKKKIKFLVEKDKVPSLSTFVRNAIEEKLANIESNARSAEGTHP